MKSFDWKPLMRAVHVPLLTILSSSLVAQSHDKGFEDREGILDRRTGTPLYQILNINNNIAWQRSDGRIWGSPNGEPSTIYPRGTASAIYGGGIVWGGKAYLDAALTIPAPQQVIRMGGHVRGSSARAGRVTGTGASAVGVDPAGADVRIYRIRRDYLRMTTDELNRDASEYLQVPLSSVTDAQAAQIVAQYQKDWDEWPVSHGAPYIDRNGNGSYNKPPAFSATFTVDSLIAGGYDEPGVAGADPNSPADQVLWTVYNDLDPASQLYASEKLGIEAQATVWGYKSTGPLGEIFFRRVKIINKGGVNLGGGTKGSLWIDSMYIAQESDPDLGEFTEDILGCDSLLSLVYIYNGIPIDLQFKAFNIAPPSIGYDFLQGPRVASIGDSAVFDLKRLRNWKNLALTSFAYFSGGSAITDPPTGVYEGALRWRKMFQGFVPDPSTAPDRLYPHPPGVPLTKFPLSGDPVTKTGFLDGQGTQWSLAPGDRRVVLSSGPFTLAPGDTQELVIGYVGGLGSDRISSVAVMRFNDRFVQNTYDALFRVSRPPSAPNVKAGELDGVVVVEWGSDPARVLDTETKVNEPGTYVFEGYNVYQLPSRGASLASAKRIATFDLPSDPTVILDQKFDPISGQILSQPVQFGTNNGIKRYFQFKRDYVKDIDEIYNGQEYYLAITAYSRSTVPGFLPTALESEPTIITVVPKVPFGRTYSAAYGDTLLATHTGSSEGTTRPIVVDATATTGDAYEVGFDPSGATFVWKVTNKTKNQVRVTGQTNQSGDDRYPVVDGVLVKVEGPPLAGKSATSTPAANRWYAQGLGAAGELQSGGVYLGANFRNGSTVAPLAYKSVEIRFVQKTGYTDLNSNATYDIGEPYTVPTTGTQKAFFYRSLQDTAYDGFYNVPFTAWDVSNPASPRQLNVVVHDPDLNKQWDLHVEVIDPALPRGGNLGHNYVWVTASNYDSTGTTYDPTKVGGTGWMGANEGANAAYWVLWLGRRGTQEGYRANVTLALVPYVINTNLDTYTFTTKAPSSSSSLEQTSAQRIGVFPNPYLAFNPAETNRFGRFVTFNNLPPRSTIRIFNLAGEIVTILRKDDSSQFIRWSLTNRNNLPVASGIYIVHIEAELPSDGTKVTKILKLAVVLEQEIVEFY